MGGAGAANNDPFGRREQEEERAGEQWGERWREECAGGEAFAECATPGVCAGGTRTLSGSGGWLGGGAASERQCGVGEEGKGWRPSLESEPRKAEGKPTWGAGMGRGPEKCTLEILEISLASG